MNVGFTRQVNPGSGVVQYDGAGASHHSGRLESAHSQRGDRSRYLHELQILEVRIVEAEGQALAEGPHYPVLIGGECVPPTDRYCRNPGPD